MSSFGLDPSKYEFMHKCNILDNVYKALSNMDMSAAVLEALKVIRVSNSIPVVAKIEKNSERSCKLRTEGNEHYSSQRYRQALECYNDASLFAPNGSKELLYAFSNRSALLFTVKAYEASYVDTAVCLELGCTGDLKEKLTKRQDLCYRLMKQKTNIEIVGNRVLYKGFCQKFFQFDVEKHNKIPCLSADVDVVSVAGEKKVVAAKDIKLGSVIALEEAFTTYSAKDKSKISCYYCQRSALNLYPCENCCFALFCDAECRKLCNSEYHKEECQIMDLLEGLKLTQSFRLAVKTVLKLKTKCKGWDQLIKESKNIGAKRLKASSVSHIYNVENHSSILCFKEDRNFVHGPMFNGCFVYAAILYYLGKIPGFFPESPVDRLKAEECFAKLCMSLSTMGPVTTELNNSAKILPVGASINVDESVGGVQSELPCHYGWFALTGKLKHSCQPNVMIAGLDNCAALIAVQPIKKKTEITVSYVNHYYHVSPSKLVRAFNIYHANLNACNCRVCKDSWGANFYNTYLSPREKKVFASWEKLRDSLKGRHQDADYFKYSHQHKYMTVNSAAKISDAPLGSKVCDDITSVKICDHFWAA